MGYRSRQALMSLQDRLVRDSGFSEDPRPWFQPFRTGGCGLRLLLTTR